MLHNIGNRLIYGLIKNKKDKLPKPTSTYKFGKQAQTQYSISSVKNKFSSS